MDRNEVMRLAREAGILIGQRHAIDRTVCNFVAAYPSVAELERFAALVAAAERDECAKVCDAIEDACPNGWADSCAAAIRARGKQQ